MVEEWLETTFSDDFVKKLRCRDSGVDVDVEDKVLISCYGHGYSDLFGRKRRIWSIINELQIDVLTSV